MTLTLTLDDLENRIVRFVSSTSLQITLVHMAPLSLIVNGRTDGQTYFHQRQQVIFAKSNDVLKNEQENIIDAWRRTKNEDK